MYENIYKFFLKVGLILIINEGNQLYDIYSGVEMLLISFYLQYNVKLLHNTLLFSAETADSSWTWKFWLATILWAVSKYNIHKCKLAWWQTHCLWHRRALSVIWEWTKSTALLWIHLELGLVCSLASSFGPLHCFTLH